ncbi:unnamed protein product [Ambrosiozyma monospora]|uniref:Unnamed protein product n=1 Tax=Ambrosiozyma monospora TaxID=43982 RepID=A0ACB5T768_AMBMO|nr:unnamed protein product [Ambrosiozyma monospora]
MSGSGGYLAVGAGDKNRFRSGSGSESGSFGSRSGLGMGSFGSFGKKNGSGLATVVENGGGVGNGKVAKIQESLKVARKRGGLSRLFKSGFN